MEGSLRGKGCSATQYSGRGEDMEAGKRQDVMSGICERSLLFLRLFQESKKIGLR